MYSCPQNKRLQDIIYAGKLNNILLLSTLCSFANAIQPCLSHMQSSAITFIVCFPISHSAAMLQGISVSYSHTPALALVLSDLWQNSSIQHLWASLTASQIFWTPHLVIHALFRPKAAVTQSLRALGEALMDTNPSPGTMTHTDARQLKVARFLILPWYCLHRGRGSLQAEA